MSRSDTSAECLRKAERFRLDGATWDHGRVVNLSSAGACLIDERTMSPIRGGTCQTIQIGSGGQTLTLPVEVRWTRHSASASGRLIGVHFPTLSPAYAKAIETFARFGYVEPILCAERASQACDPHIGAEPDPSAPGSKSSQAGDGHAGNSQQAAGKKTDSVSRPTVDLYRMLGLRPDASEEDIKTAFRREAARWHPDTCSSPDAAERFMDVSKAYRVLRDQAARAQYDALLRAVPEKKAATETSSPADRRDKGRLRCAELRCNLGEVLNASADGLQVLGKRRFGQKKGKQVNLRLTDGGQQMHISAEIAWIFDAGNGRRMGLQLHFANEQERMSYWQMVRGADNVACNSMDGHSSNWAA
jgi:hypothetical protein